MRNHSFYSRQLWKKGSEDFTMMMSFLVLQSCLTKSSPYSLYWLIQSRCFPVSAPICFKVICCWEGSCKCLLDHALMWWGQLCFYLLSIFICQSLIPYRLGAPCSCSSGSFLKMQWQLSSNPICFLGLLWSGKHCQHVVKLQHMVKSGVLSTL